MHMDPAAVLSPTYTSEMWLELRQPWIVDLTRRGLDTRPLALALASGLPVDPDPRRPDFYQVVVGRDRYYLHVRWARPPRVYLLARRP